MNRAPILASLLAISLAVSSACTPTPQAGTGSWASVRVANLAPDLAAIDFCFAAQGTGNFLGPQMLAKGETGGLQYANPARQVGWYGLLLTGTWVVRIVPAGAADCAGAIVPDATISLSEGVSYTVAVTGLATSTTAPHSTYTWTDDTLVPSGQVWVRFVNAAMASATSGSAPLDAGTGAPAAFRPLFRNVLFPGPAAPSATVNANGYASLAPGDLAVGTTTVTACLSGVAPGPATCPVSSAWGGPPMPALYAGTLFAVGGTPTAPWRMLTCLDNVPGPVLNYSWCL